MGDVAKAIDLKVSSLLGFVGCGSRVRCEVLGIHFMLRSRSLVTLICVNRAGDVIRFSWVYKRAVNALAAYRGRVLREVR